MPRLSIRMCKGTDMHELVGFLWKSPIMSGDRPVEENPRTIRLGNNGLWLELAPGRYVFRFDHRTGVGGFELKARVDKTDVGDPKKYDGTPPHEGLHFDAEVL